MSWTQEEREARTEALSRGVSVVERELIAHGFDCGQRFTARQQREDARRPAGARMTETDPKREETFVHRRLQGGHR